MTVLGFAGFSGSGKTTLIEKLIPFLKEKGLKVAAIKHDAHDFDMDREGKDTYRFGKAGADVVMISSGSRSARLSARERSLDEMLKDTDNADIVLVEGYKNAPIDKIGITSIRTGHKLPEDVHSYLAVACDDVTEFMDLNGTPVFDLNDIERISEWIVNDIMARDDDSDMKPGFSHFDDKGNARMVNVSDKDITVRTATAGARVLVNRTVFDLIKEKNIKKGDVLTVAQIAGIMGAKRTPELIPMCHPLLIDAADVSLSLNEKDLAVDIEATVKCTGRTGVEMEAICACSVAAMTVYDMCKSVQRDILLTDIRLLKKTGGVHGDYIKKTYRLAAAVLIGGHSKRMGRPKENIMIEGDGRTFLEKICDELDLSDEIFSGRKYLSVRKGQKITRTGYVSVEDRYDDIGPLGGILSVLEAAKRDGCDGVLVLACDMIHYTRHEAEGICSSYNGEDILWARTGGKKIQPLASIYGVNILSEVQRAADEGRFRIRDLEMQVKNTRFYDSSDTAAYDNINSMG